MGRFRRHIWWMVTLGLTVPVWVYAQVASNFVAGTPVSAAGINKRFNDLDARIATLEAQLAAPIGILGSVTYAQGSGGLTLATGDVNYHWLPDPNSGIPVTMTVAAGDKVTLSGTASIFPTATSTLAGINYVLAPCYRPSAQPATLTTFGAQNFSEHDSSLGGGALNYHVIPIHGTVTFTAAGTFDFGVCGRHSNATNPAASYSNVAYTALRFK